MRTYAILACASALQHAPHHCRPRRRNATPDGDNDKWSVDVDEFAERIESAKAAVVGGLAASVAGVKEITDSMLYAAAVACVDAMTPEEFASGRTFPAIDRIRDVSRLVAVRVIEVALKEGLTTKVQQSHIDAAGSLEALVSKKMYDPLYVPLVDPSK